MRGGCQVGSTFVSEGRSCPLVRSGTCHTLASCWVQAQAAPLHLATGLSPPIPPPPRPVPQTLALHLIEGVIDQVDGSVQVSWVQPRILILPQVRSEG